MWDGVLRGMDAVEHDMREKERREHKGKLQELQNEIKHLKKERKKQKCEIQKLQDEISCLKENEQTNEMVLTNYNEETINEISEELAIHVMDNFEDFLDEHDITIPCELEDDEEYRVESATNVRIYGNEYCYLEDCVRNNIKRIIIHLIRKYSKKHDKSSLKGKGE